VLDAATREQFAWEADQARQIMGRMASDGMRLGRIFISVRDRIAAPGKWTAWLAELNVSERSAERLMTVARRFSDPTLVSAADWEQAQVAITISAAYLLAAPSAPPEALRQAIAMTKRGKIVGKKDAARLIDAAKDPSGPAIAEQRAWERGIGTLERTSRRLAESGVPTKRAVQDREGDTRCLCMVQTWVDQLLADLPLGARLPLKPRIKGRSVEEACVSPLASKIFVKPPPLPLWFNDRLDAAEAAVDALSVCPVPTCDSEARAALAGRLAVMVEKLIVKRAEIAEAERDSSPAGKADYAASLLEDSK
jgi:hypothetical protein